MEANDVWEIPELPSLNDGIHLLETDSRTSGALQSLVLDHLLTRGGAAEAVWVDSRGNCSTQPFARLAPSMRVLKRIEVARGFTAFQHYSLLDELDAQVGTGTALVVLPGFDWFYRNGDLRQDVDEEMLSSGVELVEDLQEQSEVPVLLTRADDDGFSRPIRRVADEVIRCELTPQGPRFTGDRFETLVYPGAGFVQTALTYWSRILTRRHPEAVESPAQLGVAAIGAN